MQPSLALLHANASDDNARCTFGCTTIAHCMRFYGKMNSIYIRMFGPKTFSSIACRYVLVELHRTTLHRVMVYVYPCTGNGEILATALIIIIK